MVSDDSTTAMLDPLGSHVEAQVKHLTAVADVVRELRSSEEQYAKKYAELPFDVPADSVETLERLPQLRDVSENFTLFVRRCSAIKAAVAEDLAKNVIAPLEEFTAHHTEKAQHLLSELYELLQREKAFDLAYENLREGCKEDPTAVAHGGSSATGDSNEQDDSELQLHRAHMEQLLRKRDAERLTIQQWITALHFAGQSYEAHVRGVLRHILFVYNRMIDSLTALVGELHCKQRSRDASESNLAIGSSSNNNGAVTEEAWESFMAGYDCHAAITCWMSELFKQMIPVEIKTAKRLQKSVKLDRAVCKAFNEAGFSAPLSGLIQFHGLLTVNIADPIIRTLKFSRERQERMRKELSKSLEETGTLVANARARLEASDSKEKADEKPPVRSNSLTSSETSECSVEDNNGGGDQNAAPQDEAIESSPEQIHFETMKRKLALQQQEMARVLEQTAYLAVKTMELMVQDHVKHVTKALITLKGAIQAEPPKPQHKKSEAAPQPWDHITERLSIGVSDQQEFKEDTVGIGRSSLENSVATQPVARRRRKNCKTSRSVSEPSVVQVALSFAQSAVGMACWAVEVCFKTAKTHMPHSFEERVVLAILIAMILMLVSVCVKSSQLQRSSIGLTDAQHLSAKDLVQVMKLSLEVCGQPVTAAQIPY